MTTLQINITKEILWKSSLCGHFPAQLATEKDLVPTSCAVALAVRDIFPNAYVGHGIMYTECTLTPQNSGYYLVHLRPDKAITLPYEAASFICSFDKASVEERVAMEPFSFEIEVPDNIIDDISLDELKESLKGHSTLQLVTT